jgi:hypothetical protein
MRRSWLSRLLASVLALGLVVLATEPVLAMHRCPMHDGMMGMRMTPTATTTAGDHAPAPAHHHECTCLGDCAGAVHAALPGSPVALELAIVTAASRNGGLADYAYVPVRAQHILPFSNAPPAPLA